MNLTSGQQFLRWGIFFAVIFGLIYLLGSTFTPFAVGAAVAYFLDPVADRLEKLGLSRIAAVTIIMLFGVAIFILALTSVVPLLIEQLSGLIQALPVYFNAFADFLNRRFPNLLADGGIVRDAANGMQSSLKDFGSTIANSILSSTLAVFNFVVLAFFVPIVVVYLLVDWDKMIRTINSWLPREHAPTIRRLAKDIDKTMSSFVRGQVSVCVILGTFYSVALLIAGLNFALIVGFIAGAVTFIPYLGALIGGTLAIGIALYQFWGDWLHVLIIAAIFFAGQFIEGNIITPRLVGKSVGLHPVWLLFALAAFGKLFGFIGLLIAVPVAASIGVLFRFALDRYLNSPLYLGENSENSDAVEK